MVIFALLLTATLALAAPGHDAHHGRRNVGHHHHRREAVPDDVVYETVMVTEYVTYTQTGSLTAADATAASPLAASFATNPIIAAAVVPAVTTSPSTALAAATTPVASIGSSTTLGTTTSIPAVVTSPAASSSTTTPAATTSKSTGSGVGSGVKRGLAWPSANPVSAAGVFSSHASALGWYHNWGSGSTSALSSIPFVYTQWGNDNINNLAAAVPSGSILVGPNEPDQGAQANMSPAAVAALYRQYLTPLRKSGQVSRLGSPACSNGGSGITWLTEFLAACADCEIDFITQHWYGPTLAMLETQLAAVHALAPTKPVWVTEFACTNWNVATNPSQADVAAFMSAATTWMDSTSWIERYAWFGAELITDAALGAQNMLVTNDYSSLSALGKQYLGLA
ncbi:hypothetical protein PYCC9005_004173 [Savitreella phatthalungensis]